jgi:hypothetical protein
MSATAGSQRRGERVLSGVETVGVLLGGAMGLIAAAPLLWLAAEAGRTGNPELHGAARFSLLQLGLLWFSGAVFGGYLAAYLARRLGPLLVAAGRRWARHLAHLLGGALLIALLAPAPAAALLALAAGGLTRLPEFYLVGGGLVAWQSGVIAFVFLYTFRTMERLRA